MPARPLLLLPRPIRSLLLPALGGGSKFGYLRVQQIGDTVLCSGACAMFSSVESSCARTRAVLRLIVKNVFEIAGKITDFWKAVANVPGLEFMAENESDFPADENFATIDKRRATAGQDRTDQNVRRALVSRDARCPRFERAGEPVAEMEAGESLGTGYTPFSHLFRQLRGLRPWGPQDRIPDETIAYWREQAERRPDDPVRQNRVLVSAERSTASNRHLKQLLQ